MAAAKTTDASLDPVLNGIRLPDGRTVAWAVAFPRPPITMQECRDCGRGFPYTPQADICAACVDAAFTEVAA